MRKRILEGQFRKDIAEGHFRKGIAEGHFRKGRKGTVHKLEFLPIFFLFSIFKIFRKIILRKGIFEMTIIEEGHFEKAYSGRAIQEGHC